jgi:pimeloyl-[acyl-carrier protein] methyl ester esterase
MRSFGTGRHFLERKSLSLRNLILLHGWATDSRIWDKQRAALEDRAHLWTPDLPVWEAAWLGEKLQGFDPAETILVGWSLGGMLALEAVAAGFRPRALITISACASFCRRPDYGLGVSPAVVRGMRQRLKTEPGQVVQEFYQQLLAPAEVQWQESLQNLLPQGQDQGWLANGLDYLRTQDLRKALPEVTAQSLLIVHGDRDRIAAPAQAYFLREQLPGSRLVILPGAGHAPMVSRSQELNELIADFL